MAGKRRFQRREGNWHLHVAKHKKREKRVYGAGAGNIHKKRNKYAEIHTIYIYKERVKSERKYRWCGRSLRKEQEKVEESEGGIFQ